MRRMAGIVVGAAASLALVGGVAWAAHLTPSTTSSTGLIDFHDGSPEGDGTSHLTRTDGMALVMVEAENLVAGNAYTAWWVVFNQPENCSDEACGEDDIFLPSGDLNVDGVLASEIGIGNATGNIAKADGTAEFGARLKRNDNSGAHQIVFPAGLDGNALLTASPHDAEIHIVLQSHGQARGGNPLLAQLTYLEANCTPNCVDVQAAIHMP